MAKKWIAFFSQTGSEIVAGAAEDEDVVGHEEVCVRAAKVESAESAARKTSGC